MNWSHCWFGHGDRLRERDADGRLILVCAACGDVLRVFETKAVKGPQSEPARVLGQPGGKAKRQWPEKVREFHRQSEK